MLVLIYFMRNAVRKIKVKADLFKEMKDTEKAKDIVLSAQGLTTLQSFQNYECSLRRLKQSFL